MFKSLDIQEHMEVVGSDEKHVGTVDRLEGAERIVLTNDDPKAGGQHHLDQIRIGVRGCKNQGRGSLLIGAIHICSAIQ